MFSGLFRAVIPNRGAATHKVAVNRCRGVPPNIELYSFFSVLIFRVPHIVIFSQVKVPPNFSFPEGYREPKNIEKHWLD
jgi:hypothetical protein